MKVDIFGATTMSQCQKAEAITHGKGLGIAR